MLVREHTPLFRFDPRRRAASDSLRNSCRRLAEHLEAHERDNSLRSRRRNAKAAANFAVAVEALVCNLLRPEFGALGACLAVPRNNNVMWGGARRYRIAVFGQHFLDAMSLAERCGFIETVTRGYHVHAFQRRQSSTIRPTKTLVKFMDLPDLNTIKSVIALEPIAEPIVLKGSNRKPLDYRDDEKTERWRSELNTINRMLRSADIAMSGNDLADEEGFIFSIDDRELRRIFNNGDWNQGGRLYGGFWQNMPRQERFRAIRIDGQPIANVDFRQFNLRLAYVKAGIEPPQGDLYDLTGLDKDRDDCELLREATKKLVNALLNVWRPLRRWPGRTLNERCTFRKAFAGQKLAEAVAAIKEKHAAIASYFECGAGLRFMRTESDILIASVLELIDQGIVALPLHDAVLVTEGNAAIAKEIMQDQAERRTGATIPAKIETDGEAG